MKTISSQDGGESSSAASVIVVHFPCEWPSDTNERSDVQQEASSKNLHSRKPDDPRALARRIRQPRAEIKTRKSITKASQGQAGRELRQPLPRRSPTRRVRSGNITVVEPSESTTAKPSAIKQGERLHAPWKRKRRAVRRYFGPASLKGSIGDSELAQCIPKSYRLIQNSSTILESADGYEGGPEDVDECLRVPNFVAQKRKWTIGNDITRHSQEAHARQRLEKGCPADSDRDSKSRSLIVPSGGLGMTTERTGSPAAESIDLINNDKVSSTQSGHVIVFDGLNDRSYAEDPRLLPGAQGRQDTFDLARIDSCATSTPRLKKMAIGYLLNDHVTTTTTRPSEKS